MGRRKLVAGNWKMNGLTAEGLALVREVARRAAAEPPAAELVICPPATLLWAASDAVAAGGIGLGGQDCHPRPAGAHTGNISAAMLRDVGCSHVIVGHSERRTEHHESDALVRAKAKAARAAGLVVILCIGETAQQRDNGHTLQVVTRQLAGSVPEGLTAAELVIAYEPVWAIGTGRTPTIADITAVHAHIRAELAKRVGNPAALRVLYGGSVKPGNARALLGAPEIDGALVGGASLIADDFWAIARAAG